MAVSGIEIDIDAPEKADDLQGNKAQTAGIGLLDALKKIEDQQITTPYFSIKVENEGRRLILDIHGDIKSSLHNRLVTEYCRKLMQRGLRFNADDVPFPVDSEIKLSVRTGRGTGSSRRFDIVYVDEKNESIGVEIKTKGDVGANHTAEQLKAYGKAVSDKILARVILIVPCEELENARDILGLLNLQWAINIETY